ncbi:MAG: exonuclease SbcCD subunit D, partial [Acidobacteriota bacterium]
MKLLVFADLHLDTTFRWLGNNLQGARKLRNSLRTTLQGILDLAREEQVDAILCAGDLYEQDHFSPDTRRFVEKAFREVEPIPLYLAPGNHDWLGPSSLYATASWSPNVKIFEEEKFQPVELAEGLNLWGYAHCGPAQFANPLQNFKVDRGGVNLALFHGSESRIAIELTYQKNQQGHFDADDIRRAGFDHAFVGHYHNAIDEPLFTYPGNPHPLEFGEDGTGGPVVVKIDSDGTLERRRVRVAEAVLFDLQINVSEAETSQDICDLFVAKVEGRTGFARVWL